jgi:hypothetical protein
MTLSHPFLSASSAGAKRPLMATFGQKKVTDLTSILYEKGHELFSRTTHQKTLALSVNEICRAIIQAYASTFESRLQGNPLSPTADILKYRELSVCFSIKGSTVSHLLEDQDLSSLDLDTSFYFDKIPVPKEALSSDQTVQAFFSSPAGRAYLRDFYIEVACEATKRLLRLNNEKIATRNILLAHSLHALIPFKTEEEIDLLKDKFFNNLMLFAGNGTFLLTFGSIDFAIKVPFMNAVSNTHVADSLEINIPLHHKTCHTLPQEAFLSSTSPMDEALALLRQKKVSIFEPHKIQFNGFERIMYALAQGWSVIEKEPLCVLLLDLHTRTFKEHSITEIPLERLHFLLTKKISHAGVGQTFALRLFLNAYQSVFDFSKEGLKESGELIDVFHKAYVTKEYMGFFPSYVAHIFSKPEDLNQVLFYEILKLFLGSCITLNSQVASHLGKKTLILGKGSKSQGCLLAHLDTLSSMLASFDLLFESKGEKTMEALLSEELNCFEGQEIILKDKILLILFRNFNLIVDLAPEIQIDITTHFKHFLFCLSKTPSILKIEGMRRALFNFFSRFSSYLSFDASSIKFVQDLIPQEQNFPIIPLICQVLIESDQIKIFEAIDASLQRTVLPVNARGLISFLLEIDSSVLGEHKIFKLIEQTHKAAKIALPLPLLFHPKIQGILLKEGSLAFIDKDFWKQALIAFLPQETPHLFLDIFYGLCLQDPGILEETFSSLTHEKRLYLFKRFVKEQKADLTCLFLLHNGLNPPTIERLLKEDLILFKNKAFKTALLMLPKAQLTYIFEEFLTLKDVEVGTAFLYLWENQELLEQSQPLIDTLLTWGEAHFINKDFFHALLKLVNLLALEESSACMAIRASKHLNLAQKTVSQTFRSMIDKYSLVFLSLESSSSMTSLKEDILEAKKKTVCLMNLGVSFAGPWGIECQTLQWETKTIEEAFEDYVKKPAEPLLLSCAKCLEKTKKPLPEALLSSLKDVFKMHEPYLLELLKHVGQFYPEAFKEKFFKDTFSLFTHQESKKECFDLYIENNAALKHLGFMLQGIDLGLISHEDSLAFLDKLFKKAISDDHKVTILNRFKEGSKIRYESPGVLFEYFKQIKGLCLKKNALIDHFVSSFLKLSKDQQKELLIAPILAESTHALALMQKAETCPRALDHLNSLLNKKAEEGCFLNSSELLEIMFPLFDKFLTKALVVESKHHPQVIKFIEKVMTLLKEVSKEIPFVIFDRLLGLVEDVPTVMDVIRDYVVIDQRKMPVEFLIAFLNKRKAINTLSKGDGDKYSKILRLLLDEIDSQVVFEYFKALNEMDMFTITHKKELIPFIFAKAIIDKKGGFLFFLFGAQENLGFKLDYPPCMDLSFLKECSKSAKRMVHDALVVRLDEASDISALNVEVLSPLKYAIEYLGLDTFEVLKKEVMTKSFDILSKNLEASATLENLDAEFIFPYSYFVSYFGPCKEARTLAFTMLEKLLQTDGMASSLVKRNLEGFEAFLERLSIMSKLTHAQNRTPIIDFTEETNTLNLIEILYEKTTFLEPGFNLLELLKLVKIYASDFVKPLLTKLGLLAPELILHFMQTAKADDIIVLFKTIKKCPVSLYEQMADILIKRILKESLPSFSCFIYETLNCNLELSVTLIHAFKTSSTINKTSDLLSSPLNVFLHMIPKYFDLEKDIPQVMTVLELRKVLEGISFFTFCMRIKESDTDLHKIYLKNMSKEKKSAFFDELESGRLVFEKTIIGYSGALISKDMQIAKLYLDHYATVNPDAIIKELKGLEFNTYFKALITIHNLWILQDIHHELYPAVFEDAYEKLEGVLSTNLKEGDLSVPTIKALYETLNCLSLSYQSVLAHTGYPMHERFNPIFLRSLLVALEPKNILKEHLGLVNAVFSVLRSVKKSQISDLLTPPHLDLFEAFLRSLLRLFTLYVKDYIKKGTTTHVEFAALILGVETWQETLKHNVAMHLLEHFYPVLCERGVDLFLPFFVMLKFVNVSLMPEEFRKRFKISLTTLIETYLARFKAGFAPRKKESVINEVLALFDAKKVSREKKEYHAMRGLFELPEADIDDFKFHICQKLLKEMA